MTQVHKCLQMRTAIPSARMRSEGCCLSVCLLSHISPMERLFVLKTLSRTQRATKVKNFVGFSLKPLRCRDPALPVVRPCVQSAIMRISRVRACVFLVYIRA